MRAGLRQAVELAGRRIVAHAVGLVVGRPDGLVLRVDGDAHRIAHAAGKDVAAAAVERIHANHAADAELLVQRDLVVRLHVVRLAESDVELAVVGNAAGARAVVVGFLLDRHQLALRHHLDHRHVRAFVEELGGRKIQHAVVLDHDQEAVLGPAHAVRLLEIERRGEGLDLVGYAVAVSVGNGPQRGFARADEQHVRRVGHRHVTGIGHDRVELDDEAGRQVDLAQVVANRVGVLAGLRHRWQVQVGGGDPHLLHFFEAGLRCCVRRQDGGERGQQANVASWFSPSKDDCLAISDYDGPPRQKNQALELQRCLYAERNAAPRRRLVEAADCPRSRSPSRHSCGQ